MASEFVDEFSIIKKRIKMALVVVMRSIYEHGWYFKSLKLL